ncbi:MAG: hypothetical protein QGI83_10595 [Candidatus Latescibacteria bacterium]|jgi:peptidoglycan hydrolase CwlO-like protein|nr:hypothetical protein [Candidatus Latescibacterota bacterium]
MFLQTVTVILLALVIAVKYLTLVHKNRINQRRVEAENLRNKNEMRYKAMTKERKTAETEEENVQKEVKLLEEHLDHLKGELLEQQERNKELEEQIEGI